MVSSGSAPQEAGRSSGCPGPPATLLAGSSRQRCAGLSHPWLPPSPGGSFPLPCLALDSQGTAVGFAGLFQRLEDERWRRARVNSRASRGGAGSGAGRAQQQMPKRGPDSTLVLRLSRGFPGDADPAPSRPGTDLPRPPACFVMFPLIFPPETLTSLPRTWLVLRQTCAPRRKAAGDRHQD